MQFDLNVSRRRAEIVVDTVVAQLQFGCAHKARAVAAPWIITFTNTFYREGNAFGNAVQSEVAGNLASTFAG